PHQCARVRCKSCGFVRAKNVTRQAEHLTQCKQFLLPTEAALNEKQNRQSAIGNSAWTDPDSLLSHHHPNRPRGGMAPYDPGLPTQTPQPAEAPSLAQHLLVQAEDLLVSATHHTFLSHAGCGSLTENALNQWLTQIGYISRSLVSFIGTLIGKIRIPETANLERDSTFRCLDLLCSAVNNMKKELGFLEATKRTYGLEVNFDEPTPPTKGFIDLFNSASSPSATLLEGMVVLWAVEIVSRNPNRLLSDCLLPATSSSGQVKLRNGHITALREAFIENWKSETFSRFVNACRSIVDELVMVQTTGNGRAEMSACERVFKQAIWLWGQIFPDVAGMGEQDESDDGQNTRDHGRNGAIDQNSFANSPVGVLGEDHTHGSCW
ncbi:hypothetical protein EK21DRAFT_80446, partial [Setomelanomma holmii]